MKPFYFARWSTLAVCLLQWDSWASANPVFNSLLQSAGHVDQGLTNEDSCKDIRISFPTPGLVFDDGSKHAVAWQVPPAFSQVNITLTSDSGSLYFGTFAANQGASDEIPFTLGDIPPGAFHVVLETVGGDVQCKVESGTFTIQQRETQTTTAATAATAAPTTTTAFVAAPTTTTTAFVSPTPTDVATGQHQNAGSQEGKSWVDIGKGSAGQVNKTQSKTHSNGKSSQDPKYESFFDYIASLDMDYRKYIHKNKLGEEQIARHKNEMPTVPPYEGSKVTIGPNLEAEIRQLTKGKHNNAPFFSGAATGQQGGEETWKKEETPIPLHVWIDTSKGTLNHTNQGTWEMHVVDETALYEEVENPVDTHDNAGPWIEEQVDVASTETAVWEEEHFNDGDAEWTEPGTFVPDFTKRGEWIAQEIHAGEGEATLANDQDWHEESGPSKLGPTEPSAHGNSPLWASISHDDQAVWEETHGDMPLWSPISHEDQAVWEEVHEDLTGWQEASGQEAGETHWNGGSSHIYTAKELVSR